MSQLTDIYNSLMNDPDIVPPKKMSKDKYVLNMAQQRIQQHENNAAALEMGFVKTNGHFSNGNSAVNKLSSFVNPPEASPETDIDLLKAMKKIVGVDIGDGEIIHIEESAFNTLKNNDFSREAIIDILTNHKQRSNDPYVTSEAEVLGKASGNDRYTLNSGSPPRSVNVDQPSRQGSGERRPISEVITTLLWHKKEDLPISYNSVRDLEDKGFSRENIRQLITNARENEDEDVDIDALVEQQDTKTADEIATGIAEGEYDEELGDPKSSINFHPALKAEVARRETDNVSQTDESEVDKSNNMQDKSKEELSRTFSDTGLNALFDKLGKGKDQLFNPSAKPRSKGTGSKKVWIDHTGKEHKKESDAPLGRYVKSVGDVRNYIFDLRNPEHEHHEHFSEISNMDILDKDGKPTGQKVGEHIGIMEPELNTVINLPVEAEVAEEETPVVETPVVETPVVETPQLKPRQGKLADSIRAADIDPDSEEGRKITRSKHLEAILDQRQADADAEKAAKTEESGDTPEPKVLEAAEDISPEIEAIAETLLKSDFAKRVACERGLADKDGNPTEMGKAFFERIGPMVNESVDHFEQHKNTIAEKFGLKRGMNFRDKEGNVVGIGNSGTFLNHMIGSMNEIAVAKGLPTLEKTHNAVTGEALDDPKNPGVPVESNQAPDLSVVLNGEMVRNRLFTSRMGNAYGDDHAEFIAGLGGIQQVEQDELTNKGMNPDTARTITEEKLEEVKSGIESGEIKVADAGEDIHDAINEIVATDHPDIAETPPDYGKQLPLFEDMGFEPMTPTSPPSEADAEIAEQVQSRREQIDRGQQELSGFSDKDVKNWGSTPVQQRAEKDRRSNLTPRERQVEDLKKVMAGDLHDHLDSADDYSDKEIKDMWNKQVRDPKAQTSSEASVKAKPTAGKAFNREKAIKKLARLQNPDLDPSSEEFKRVVDGLHEDYDEEVGYTDKDIQDALKSQAKLSANQEAQQSQERQNRARGADKLRAVSDLEERFPTPEQWAKDHDGEEMSPEMAKDYARELLDFQHREENFQHFGAKTGDEEDFKALRERLNGYANLNPSAAREIAEEIKSAQRDGVEVGSDEFLNRATEAKETAEREERTASAEADHKDAKLAHALENGNFARGYDEDGKEGHHRLDHNGNPEHDSSEIEHEDGKAPVVHATDENGYPDEKLQQLVDEVHDAKLASPQENREHHAAIDALHNTHLEELKDADTKAEEARNENDKRRDDAHTQAEADHQASHADIDQRQSDAEYARAGDVQTRHRALLTEHNDHINEVTDSHEAELEQHDSDTQATQAEYDKHLGTIDKANKDHDKVVRNTSTDRIKAIYEVEQKAKKDTDSVNEQFANSSKEQLKKHADEMASHNKRGRDTLGTADANYGYLEQEHNDQLDELTDTQAQEADDFSNQQREEMTAAGDRGENEEYLSYFEQSQTMQAADFERGQKQQVMALQQTQQKEIDGLANDVLGEGNAFHQEGMDLLIQQGEQRKKLDDSRNTSIERIDAVVAHTDATARKTESDAVNQSRAIRNGSLQEVADAAGLGVSINDDNAATGLADQMGQAKSSHETASANSREKLQTDHGDYVESKRSGFKSKQGKMFAQANRDAEISGEGFDEERKTTDKSLSESRLSTTKEHRDGVRTIADAHGAAKSESIKNHGDQHGKLLSERPAKEQASADRREAAIQALKDHPALKDDPEKLEAILNNKHLGQSKEDAATAHEEAGSGVTGEKDDEGEDQKPEKTRMVEDPKTGEQKKQYWIPGRGKGWVDEDTYAASHGKNAKSAKDGKMMIYPQGHFDAGQGKEGEEGFRQPSAPMAAFGGNTFGIEHEGHADWDTSAHDDSLDHEGVIGRHLGSHPGITDHANFTAGGAPFEVDADSLGMGGIAETLGKGKGQPRDPKGGLKGQFFGEAAQKRAMGGEFAAYGRAAQAAVKPFAGATDWLKNRMGGGQQGGKQKSAVQNLHERMGGGMAGAKQKLADKMRGGRQTARKAVGGAYYGGNKPKNERHADYQSEMWRRTPKLLRGGYGASNPDHARELNHIKALEDKKERQSSMDQWKEWSKGLQDKIDSRSKM